jgi:hypothetical protein
MIVPLVRRLCLNTRFIYLKHWDWREGRLSSFDPQSPGLELL